MRVFHPTILLILGALLLSSCMDVRINEHTEWASLFQAQHTSGAFEIYDNNKEIANFYNKDLCSERLLPGAAYHPLLSMMLLQEAIVLDENKPIPALAAMDTPVILAQLYKQQSVVGYEALSALIADTVVQSYLDTMQYGNRQIGSGAYWQNGPLRVTPDEMVGFMKRLYYNELPGLSERVQTIVRGMMLQQDGDTKLYYTTATVQHGVKPLAWITGYAVRTNPLKNPNTQKVDNVIHPYFFSLVYEPTASTDGQALLISLLNAYKVIE